MKILIVNLDSVYGRSMYVLAANDEGEETVRRLINAHNHEPDEDGWLDIQSIKIIGLALPDIEEGVIDHF